MALGVREGHYRNQVPEMKTVSSGIESDVHRAPRFAEVCVYVIACGGFQKSAPAQFFEEVIIVLCCHLLKVADCPYLPTPSPVFAAVSEFDFHIGNPHPAPASRYYASPDWGPVTSDFTSF